MKMNKIYLLLAAAFGLLSVSSCMKDDDADKKAAEMRILDNYILSNNITTEPTKSGLYYIEQLAGTGDSAVEGEWIELSYTARLVSTNDVVISSDMQTAKDNGLYQDYNFYGPTRLILGAISYEGLNEGVAMMREGGKARLIFPSDLGLGKNATSNIPSYSSLIFDVELVKVIPDIKAYENELLMAYLEQNEMPTDSTKTGIYFKQNVAGTGDLPAYGNQVNLTYTGKFLSGRVFDTNSKFFSIHIGYNEVIPGFEEGVKLIAKGGSGTVVIPFYYAYGEFGRYDSNYRPLIPPFSTLVFDISVIDILTK